MKKARLIFVLIVLLIAIKSFSQKSKPDIKPDPTETMITIENKDSKDYCTSTYTNTTDDSITNVTFNTINNSSGQEGANSYWDYSWQYYTGPGPVQN